eukprot:CAMPEP_0183431248 /NCGR_PEP_ID=MMETSP0370-20130417/54694_1 /TAXON_ID=268820 /ORGANISM="Peridinium aciculiferum, Strain PAER-2" /LENGTH=255 /DNA_ID=CAMNT_0025616887 /DNA_START=76 /DNA_END=843 /DNA_ORIENTATION=+
MAQDNSAPAAEPVRDEVLERQVLEAQAMQEECPCIEAAVKNYISLQTAKATTGVGKTAGGVTQDTKSLLGCARLFLKALNALELPSAPEWGHLYPQEAEESGCDFMTRLGRYKVVRVLWQQCARAGQKPAKCLGRSVLEVVLPEVEKRIHQADAQQPAGAGCTDEQLGAFLDGFRETLDRSDGAVAPANSDRELVWCESQAAVIAARQQARVAEAKERVEREVIADDFGDQLRAALAASGEELPKSTVQFEELQD